MKLIFLSILIQLDKTLGWDFNKMHVELTMEHIFKTKNQIRNMLEMDPSVKWNKSSQTQLLSELGCKPGTHGEKKRLFVLFQETGPRIIP